MDQKLNELLKILKSGAAGGFAPKAGGGLMKGGMGQGSGMGPGMQGGHFSFGSDPLKPVRRISCCVLIPVILVAAFFAYEPVYEALAPNAIRGGLIDAVYVPDKNGGGKLWFMTDDSFYYTQRIETPGSLSISTESLFNKTYTYIYDPVARTVLSKTRKDYDSTPPYPKMFYARGAIWFVMTTITGKHEANIEVIDPASGRQQMDLQSFIDKFPQLQAGIAEMNVNDDPGEPVYFTITTRDGRDLYYYLYEDKMFVSISDYNVFVRQKVSSPVTVFALTGSDARQELYKVTGPADKLLGGSFSPSGLDKPDSVKFFYDAVATRLTPDQVYLEGLLLYQDEELAVVLHQDQIGKNADRMIMAVDVGGNVLWTLGQNQLFPEMQVTEDDPFSTTFFMKSKMRASRGGDLLLFRLEEVGIMGIDIRTGEKKWEFRP